jgi:hypothetical protein
LSLDPSQLSADPFYLDELENDPRPWPATGRPGFPTGGSRSSPVPGTTCMNETMHREVATTIPGFVRSATGLAAADACRRLLTLVREDVAALLASVTYIILY